MQNITISHTQGISVKVWCVCGEIIVTSLRGNHQNFHNSLVWVLTRNNAYPLLTLMHCSTLCSALQVLVLRPLCSKTSFTLRVSTCFLSSPQFCSQRGRGPSLFVIFCFLCCTCMKALVCFNDLFIILLPWWNGMEETSALTFEFESKKRKWTSGPICLIRLTTDGAYGNLAKPTICIARLLSCRKQNIY